MSDNLLMLLEMIEEVLEEQKKAKYDEKLKIKLANDYLDLIRSKGEPYDKAELKQGFGNPNSAIIQITNAGSDQQREDLTNTLALQPYQYKKQLVYPRSSAGKKSGGKIPNQPFIIKFSQGSSKGVTGLSERFEENLIYSLNSGQESKSTQRRVTEKEFGGIQGIADQVANASGLPKDKGWLKPDAGEVTDAYKLLANGEKRNPNPTPKTDIADENEAFRLSVKKDGAQLLSGQAQEVMSITSVVAEQLRLTDRFKQKLIIKIEKMDNRELIDSLSKDSRSQLGKEIASELFESDRFKLLFLVEAMTGNKRFSSKVSIANALLVWNLQGKAYLAKDIQKWCEQNYQNVKFGVRSRGKGRGLAARLEQAFKHFAEKSLEEQATTMELPAPVALDISKIPNDLAIKAVEFYFERLSPPKFLNVLDDFGLEIELQDFTITAPLEQQSEET